MMPRYKLVSRLDSRILSEVFMAQEEASSSAPATLCKFFFPQFVTQEFARALVAVAQEGKRVASPLIVAFDRVGFWEGRLVAVRRAIDGYALDDVIRRLHSKEVVLTPQLAIFLSAMAAKSVALIHQKELVHGALDATNVLLGFDGQVSISGLGMMRAVASSPRAVLNASKIHRAYRAPELRDPCKGTKSGDVYALGCLAYELLTLVPVGSVRSGGLSTKHDTLQPPSRLNRRINARIDTVVMRALETAAVRRQPDAQAFADGLLGLFPNIGPMPTFAELVAFAHEVFPNEVSLSGETAASDLPTADFFAIGDVAPIEGDGVDLTGNLHGSAAVSAPPLPEIEPELIDDVDLENWDAPPASSSSDSAPISHEHAPLDDLAASSASSDPLASSDAGQPTASAASDLSREVSQDVEGREFEDASAPVPLTEDDGSPIEIEVDSEMVEAIDQPANDGRASKDALDDWDAPAGQMQQVVHRWGASAENGPSSVAENSSSANVADPGGQGCQDPQMGEDPQDSFRRVPNRKKSKKSARTPSEKSPVPEEGGFSHRDTAPTQLSIAVIKPEGLALANEHTEGDSSPSAESAATDSEAISGDSDVSDDVLNHLDLLESETSGNSKRKEGKGRGAKKAKNGLKKGGKDNSNRHLAQFVFLALTFIAIAWLATVYVREHQKLEPLIGGKHTSSLGEHASTEYQNRRMAFLSVNSNVPAFVLVDDVDVGTRAPFSEIPIKPGSRRIQIIWGNEVRNHEVRLLIGDHKMYTENFDEKRKGNILNHVEQVK